MREHKQVFKMITLISQIGITMLSSIFICGLIGYVIDNRFGLHTLVVFLILGMAGGYRAVYSLIKQFVLSKEEPIAPEDEARKKEKQDVKTTGSDG